jgi:TPR repeat protein
MFEHGLCGHTVDFSRAIAYSRISAERGNQRGKYCLARVLEKGTGIEPNLEEAVSMMRELMVSGYLPAMGYYGWLLIKGTGRSVHLTAGRTLLTQAAEQGDLESCARLGEIAEGESGTRNSQRRCLSGTRGQPTAEM